VENAVVVAKEVPHRYDNPSEYVLRATSTEQ
jgi:hypothetical protein